MQIDGKLMPNEFIHRTILTNCIPDIEEITEVFKEQSPNTGQSFNVFEYFSDCQALTRVKDAMGQAVTELMGHPHDVSRGWAKSFHPGESMYLHAHDERGRKDPLGANQVPFPVGVFYLAGSSPIVFFPYHEEPIAVDVEPGTFLIFRSDFHHCVPPTPGFRQSLAANFKPDRSA